MEETLTRAARGTEEGMGAILEHAERMWSWDGGGPVTPFTPIFAAEEIADGVGFVSSFANVTALTTPGGLVLVDTGSFVLAGPTKGLVRGITEAPLDTAIFTHGHVDHCFGVELYEAESGRPARVVAHARVPDRFARYRLTRGYNGCINGRQFGSAVTWPDQFRAPDVVYQESLALVVGGVELRLSHARGETDDHTWVWVPSRRLLATGDLFIWACPNAGNPQKVQRYPREWAAALRQMAALDAEILCPGHGVPIVGAARVKQALGETAALLESLVDQTLALMNEGRPLDEILGEVRAPAALLARPYLRPIYDEPEFIVRSIWRLYGGWWDGDPAHLKPARTDALAAELAALAGGASRLADRARALLDDDGGTIADRDQALALAAHLAELAARAAPDDDAIRRVRRAVYEARSDRETSLMARNIFRAAADRAR
jgi:glyoxylase-like metal-dependent hydrolase (beta-lactamase superfamily II)